MSIFTSLHVLVYISVSTPMSVSIAASTCVSLFLSISIYLSTLIPMPASISVSLFVRVSLSTNPSTSYSNPMNYMLLCVSRFIPISHYQTYTHIQTHTRPDSYPYPYSHPHPYPRKQKLLGSDTDGQDAFGHSVSIDEDHELLVVGAPYAEDNGVTEVSGGSFCLPRPSYATLRSLWQKQCMYYESIIARQYEPRAVKKNTHPSTGQLPCDRVHGGLINPLLAHVVKMNASNNTQGERLS